MPLFLEDSRRIDESLIPTRKIKDELCEGRKFKMEIKADGCTSRKIRNRYVQTFD